MIQSFLKDLIKKKMKDQFTDLTGISADMIDQVDTDAIGAILTGLTKNATQWNAWGILDAIKSKHSWDVIKNPENYTQVLSEKKPAWILEHVLWWDIEKIIWAVAEKNNIDTEQAMEAFKFLAPLVMGYFGKQKPKDEEQLTNRLEIEQKKLEDDTKISFGSLFDQDGDGDLDLNDVMKLIV